jgi:sugar lactone lactonase YvrE
MVPIKFFCSSIAFLGLICLITGCSKDNLEDSQPRSILTISSNVVAGHGDSTVTITGTGFATVNPMTVYLNGKAAKIIASTSTQITVTVPQGCGTGQITIEANGAIVKGPIFNYEPTGTVSTFAGTYMVGFKNGIGTNASFYGVQDIILSASGDFYIVDSGNNLIRKMTSAGVVTIYAPSFTPDSASKFEMPRQIALDANNNMYVSTTFGNSIYKLDLHGNVTLLAGSGKLGFTNGTGENASFNNPMGMVVDANGNLYVADWNNSCIRKVTPSGLVSTFAGTGIQGSQDGDRLTATFAAPSDIAMDQAGNFYVADTFNNKIRKISTEGIVSTIAGNGNKLTLDGQSTSASFYMPSRIAIDDKGNIIVAEGKQGIIGESDYGNLFIRYISSSGYVSTLAGNGYFGFADGPGNMASFNTPGGIAIDKDDNVFIADAANAKIRKITLR